MIGKYSILTLDEPIKRLFMQLLYELTHSRYILYKY